MRIGVLTGGGDVPGLNAALRGVTRRALVEGYEVLGIRNGWLGLLEPAVVPFTADAVGGILPRGGTILGTSRTNPFKRPGGPERVLSNVKEMEIDALIAIGGDDTLGVALNLWEMGMKIVGIPKTIDNDVPGTDYCIGFDTGVNLVMDALDRLHPTAEAHHRVMVVEVMGRDAGWVATLAGLAGGADVIVIPERPMTIEEICGRLDSRQQRGKGFSIVVVAEGAKLQNLKEPIMTLEKIDEFGHMRLGGVGHALAREVEERTGYETRVTVLGHAQRGGSPTARDRVLATRMGVKAVELVKEGQFGTMVALRGRGHVP